MSSDAENYRIAKEQQEVFRDVIKNCMEGKVDELKTLQQEFLSKNPSYTAEEFFTGFQSEGRTLLHIAASSGHNSVFEHIIGNLSSPGKHINLKDEKGFTPLINATISESDTIMEALIKLGADVNARNRDGASAIHFAAGDGSVSRMELLCSAGAQLDQLSQAGSPLHWAAGKARSDAIKYLLEKIQSTSGSKASEVINQVSKEGLPAVLMAAVASCDLGVSYLVQAGADIGKIVSGNLTTLHICAEHGLAAAVEAIVYTESGLRCCAVQTTDGNTPLQLAAMGGHRDVVSILVPYSDLSYLSNEPSFKELPIGSTVFSDKTVPVSEALINCILAEGVKHLEQWHEQQKVKTEMAAAEAENTEFKKMTSAASTSETVTPETEAAAEKHKEAGNVHYKAGCYQEAVDAYTEALYLNKFNATYWSNRSAVYLSMKQPEKALKDAEICRHLNPNWSRGCYRLASARLALKQYEDAAVAAFEGVKLDEGNKELKALLQRAVLLGQEEHKRSIAKK